LESEHKKGTIVERDEGRRREEEGAKIHMQRRCKLYFVMTHRGGKNRVKCNNGQIEGEE